MGQVVHFELSVPRPEEAAAFYSAVFGWSAQKLPDPVKYWQLRPSTEGGARGIPGGIVQSKTGAARVSITVEVDSLEEAVAKVTRHGGVLVTEPRSVPGYGVHVLCRDPQGCFFALLEPGSK